MRLYDTISQSDLNDAIDLLVYNYHRELSLDIDDSSNSYCELGFDLSDGVDAGEEVIFNSGDNLRISVDDKRLALMGYTLRFYYYLLDKGDYSDSRSFGDLRSFDVKLDSDEVVVPFTDNQVYLQKNFELILLKDIGYRLLLSTPSQSVMPDEDVVLTADYTLGSVPVEDAEVSFYDGETLLGTGVTDSDGLAVLTVSDLSIGTHNFNAVVDGVYSNNVLIAVNKFPTNITLSSNKSIVLPNETFTLSGTLSIGRGYPVHMYQDDTLIDTLTTGENGEFNKTISLSEMSSFNYKVAYEEDSDYERATSNNVRIGVVDNKSCMELSVNSNSFRTYSTSPFGYTGRVFVDWGDESFVEYTGGQLSHSFTDGVTNHTVKVYGDLTSLGDNCFRYKSNLTSIELPSSVTSIGNNCFDRCYNLTSIILPNNITSIGNNCFDDCGYLTSINIPSSVTSLGTQCFYNCIRLTQIILNWDALSRILTYDSNRIYNTPSSLKFNIPTNTTNLYTNKRYPSDKLEERT